jgi:carboxyl-terminal processing protease
MIRTDPDCHTYYLDGRGGVKQSRPEQSTGSAAQIPGGGTFLQQQPDQAGLQAKILDGGIAYITWHAFETTGTYRINDALKAVLDKAIAAGAKAWLFDLRANIGGDPPGLMSSWFLNGEPTLKIIFKNGNPTTQSASKELRLGPAYQLPIAIILNGRGGSSPEVFAVGLKENKRATIVGSKSTGCLGGTSLVPLGSDGSQLYVVAEEYVGAITGTKYNNVGIQPDVPADDATAVTAATKVLLDKIAGR